MDFLGSTEFSPGPEQDNRADNRQDETGGMKRRPGRRFRKDPGDQAAHDGTTDAEKRCGDEAEMLHAGHDGARNPADNETDNDRPNDV